MTDELTITLSGTGNAGKEAYKTLLTQFFTREVNSRGGNTLFKATNLYAKCITLQRAIEEVLSDKEAQIIELFMDAGNPIGERCDLGEECFTVSDREDFNYSGNDDDGLWRLKQQQIDSLMSEKKVLTKEQGAIEERIRLEHPNMRVEHNYVLLYKGNVTEVESGNR